MTKFYVYGDYGYTSENELYSHESRVWAERWADNYTRWGDMGGYDVIEVAYFDEDGEYHVVWRMDSEDPEYAGDLEDEELLYEDDGS